MWNGKPVHWRGLASYQLPSDLWAYQEIIHDCRPTHIVETGNGDGGTTLFLAACAEPPLVFIIAIDQRHQHLPKHPRIMPLLGSTLDEGIIAILQANLTSQPTTVILDSDVYSELHVAAELEAYAPLVTPGQYLIVCKTHRPDWGAAPALERFLAEHPEFEQDFERQPDPTLNPGGYLRRR